ncbi:alpha/beta hydrolase [Desulfovibrio gilichinskyi]|uniref:Alpha/beta hydrolase family protein n=1 Tax=Desulfovibrio gilichinskyi TaxID=1519643 RepID=A0A1X7EJQ9_9BACT|nr:hypothetical protein [Desulfovibrio gilichinskyi]SMF34707.1 hypothetical protein SAMN06295933_3038 [Desulfovibrio gilichinskyi]
MIFRIGLIFFLFVFSGCTSFSPRLFAEQHGFLEHIFVADTFDIAGYMRGKSSILRVYFEGDGKAWLNRRRPSTNPTPQNPVSFYLAAVDTNPAVLYLARPCQFVEGPHLRSCSTPFWTSARFSEPVIHDLNQALDQAKSLVGAKILELVGYSGGGAVALLLAARRDDVDLVVTIAGNLDHDYWTRYHHVSPLRDSLNPADYAVQNQVIKQVHIVSTEDLIIPPSVSQSYLSKMNETSMVRIVTVHGVKHMDDWSQVVPSILKKVDQHK